MNPKTIKKSIQNLIVLFICTLIDVSVVFGAFWTSVTLIFEILSMRERVF